MFVRKVTSENAPKAIGPYSPAVKLGDFVYMSGQIAIDPATGNLVEGDIKAETEQVMKNICALLAEMHLETRHIVKTTVYITNMNDFAAINEVYASYFDEKYPAPARSCVEVRALPKNAHVEVECFVIDTLVYEQQTAQSSCSGCSGGCNSCEGCSE